MKTDNSDPIPLPAPPQHVGTIMIRFVGLLLVAVAVLANLEPVKRSGFVPPGFKGYG